MWAVNDTVYVLSSIRKFDKSGTLGILVTFIDGTSEVVTLSSELVRDSNLTLLETYALTIK